MDHDDTNENLETMGDESREKSESSIDPRAIAREKARKRKADRANDPRYQALKASWQKARKEAYQKQKEKAKALRQEKKKSEREARMEARKTKDSELVNCLKPGIDLPESPPKFEGFKLKLVYNASDKT